MYSEPDSSPLCAYFVPVTPLAISENEDEPFFLASTVYPVMARLPSSAGGLQVMSMCLSFTGFALTFIGGLGSDTDANATRWGSITPVWNDDSIALIVTGSEGGVLAGPILACTRNLFSLFVSTAYLNVSSLLPTSPSFIGSYLLPPFHSSTT